MKFLIDENIRREVTKFLRTCGYDVKSVPKGRSDEELAKMAKKETRIIMTHDNDFTNRLLYPPEKFSGIIRIKIHPPTKEAIIRALKDLFSKLSEWEFDQKLIILDRDGFRIGP